ncbi:SRPBCC family protein [Streptomyces sp. B21-106]|uniref:SRPBCC family protein n=1 Tax=Streptomyces sp. B21-106 TaxID=3039418 RepID=UPI002FF1D7C0
MCLAEDPPPFEEDVIGEVVARLGDVESIERYDIDNLSVGRRIVYDVKANWKLIIENFMECYHCATIHPELTEVHAGVRGRIRRASTTWATALSSARRCGGSRSTARRVWTVSRASRRSRTVVTTRSPCGAQVFINLVPDHVIFHRMYPVAVDRTIVECDWLYLPHVVEEREGRQPVRGALRPGQPAGLPTPVSAPSPG